MGNSEEWDNQAEHTRQIIEELINDGSDLRALYMIEHHFSAHEADVLKIAAASAFQLGYEVTDTEELKLEDGSVILCFDAIRETTLDAELIDVQVVQLVNMANKCNVSYDGWGTYYQDPNGEIDDGNDEIEWLGDDYDGKRH
ncbi:hypothetical protein REG_0348 [Candidatus Regiella insecticola LSR1]|uniref:Regulator of ribonuclease activity B n=1 Tax=Candidatus Regiella insecticola LSR1 TaxID=663321 RepID=E0WQY5_9ENTR|nr:ribonuclease E inhibitor RraB [Candidatus Regiella insecticola]EFL92545.1 hypothetical protein REG_0348 [Candidatus Regiella insecticola LSR1]